METLKLDPNKTVTENILTICESGIFPITVENTYTNKIWELLQQNGIQCSKALVNRVVRKWLESKEVKPKEEITVKEEIKEVKPIEEKEKKEKVEEIPISIPQDLPIFLAQLPYKVLAYVFKDERFNLTDFEVQTSSIGWNSLLEEYLPKFFKEKPALGIFAISQLAVLGSVLGRVYFTKPSEKKKEGESKVEGKTA